MNKNISIQIPRFLFAPDQEGRELYIVCSDPLAMIWVKQTIPAHLYIVQGEQSESMLHDCGEWYKKMVCISQGGS